ncbi:OmpA/MotB family protein [Acetivibrio clariflavus]|uniref:OmpA/MotB family protein n=1 Tax=Acetivibrio clariflavus TaxID=288965 RepID=UPI00047F08F8|nr:flagellar motor protein MotB [Acetivibrio clariflavus]HPU41888.1 flagellar motor protein MotB [Acetivibrio clariflavus]
MSKKNRRTLPEDDAPEGAAEWLTTYSDMVTLLLTFFVLLFSMATVDKQKFQEVAYSLKSAFMNISRGEIFYNNRGEDIISILDDNLPDISEEQNSTNNNDNNKAGSGDSDQISEFKEQVERLISEMDLGEYVQIIDNKTSLILRINSVILFDLGKADIKESGKDTIRKIAELMKQLNSEIIVQGHTDNLPIKTSLYPTNWELSTKRATNVVLFLINECSLDPTRLTATGNGEYRPVAPNDTEENRQKNRRIDIVISKYK